jgi:hypothetical protein
MKRFFSQRSISLHGKHGGEWWIGVIPVGNEFIRKAVFDLGRLMVFAIDLKNKQILRIIALVMSAIILCTSSGFAKSVDQHVNILSVVFLAQQISAICGLKHPEFLEDARGPLGTMSNYSQYFKEEVVIGLSSEEASSVLLQAAGFARSAARAKLLEFAIIPGVVDDLRLHNWCETVAKPKVKNIITMFENKHNLFHCKIIGGTELTGCAP